jgi:hypothetical protein
MHPSWARLAGAAVVASGSGRLDGFRVSDLVAHFKSQVITGGKKKLIRSWAWIKEGTSYRQRVVIEDDDHPDLDPSPPRPTAPSQVTAEKKELDSALYAMAFFKATGGGGDGWMVLEIGKELAKKLVQCYIGLVPPELISLLKVIKAPESQVCVGGDVWGKVWEGGV